MRKLLALVTIAVVAVGAYTWLRDRESLKIRREMLRLVNDLEMTPPQLATVRGMVESMHNAVFARALDLARNRGHKFDVKLYYDEMFARMIHRAKADDPDLAERLSTQQPHHELTVRER